MLELDYSFKPVFTTLIQSDFTYSETTQYSAKKGHSIAENDIVILDSIGDGFEIKKVFIYKYSIGTIRNQKLKLIGYMINPYLKLNCMFIANKEQKSNKEWNEDTLNNIDILSPKILKGDKYSDILKNNLIF